MIHGDDFISVGGRVELQEFKSLLAKRFEISTKILGVMLEQGDVQEAKVLNRVIRVDHEGWHYEVDQRHAELLIKQLGLTEAKGVSTPGEGDKPWMEEKVNEALRGREVTEFRAMAARANYLAQDRSDIQYAAKKLPRGWALHEVPCRSWQIHPAH